MKEKESITWSQWKDETLYSCKLETYKYVTFIAGINTSLLTKRETGKEIQKELTINY